MAKRFLSLLIVVICATLNAMAQLTTVKGNVVDKTAEPIIGASVTITGTTKGTVTDIDGNFTLQADANAELTISYIGFKTKKVKVGNGNLKIVLDEENASLDEVVIVGAVMRKGDLTGSVAMVDSKTLEQRPVTNVNEAIQGRMPGVSVIANANPADDSSIKIRGVNTINSGSDPIYVVDGQVMDNSFGGFSSINPNDVENIQVLKDASATAIYGSRGANGVVLITTKKAKRGEGKVSYAGFISATTKSHLPKTMSAQQLGDLRIDAFANGYMLDHPNADRQTYINTVHPTNRVIKFA
jgi:TonB-dependent SusC/RagA subfamily outer membrane receptor